MSRHSFPIPNLSRKPSFTIKYEVSCNWVFVVVVCIIDILIIQKVFLLIPSLLRIFVFKINGC